MGGPPFDKPADDDPIAQLERAFIDEFLRGRGYSLATLHEVPEETANALLKAASTYASGRLTEVESRAHLLDDLHHGAPNVPGRPPGRTV